jgi:two-component system, OmpR family, sensor histidine kinase KdpD
MAARNRSDASTTSDRLPRADNFDAFLMLRPLRFASMVAAFARTGLTANTDYAVRSSHYLRGLGITALCTLIAYPVYPNFDPVNIVMIYLLGTTVAALRLGRGPSAVTAIANVIAFDFFFVPPRYSFYVAETQYLFTLGVMLGVALVIANLMVNIRRQTIAAAERERRTETLYAVSRDLTAAVDATAVAEIAGRHAIAYGLPGARPAHPEHLNADQQQFLEALALQVAQALERVRLADAAAQSSATAERAVLRNTLLASISHDLRGPLSAIAGAGSLVAQTSNTLDRHRRVTLGQLIEEKARDMSGLLSNVLELMKLESSSGPARPDWQSVEDLVGTALRNNEHRLNGWILRTDLRADLPLIYADGQLLVQLLSNLLENATRHTPHGTSILISARESAGTLLLIVEDDGPGFGTRDPEALFEKFERGKPENPVSGVGLGLAICRAIAQLHGGRIRAANRTGGGGGARFSIELPLPARFAQTRASGL